MSPKGRPEGESGSAQHDHRPESPKGRPDGESGRAQHDDGRLSSRDDILARVRRNQPAPRPLPAVPDFATEAGPPFERFKAALLRMGGKLVAAPPDGDFEALVVRLFPDAKVVVSATPEVAGNRSLPNPRSPAELADVDVGIVRAEYGVAETGSVWLSETHFKVNALGFLAQHLVVLLDPARIVGNLHDAYRERGHLTARYGVFMTGPSATADIEGVLIHGAQGIRTLTVIAASAQRAKGR
jgi:L-lactate dehydrogenase complex protein LldG